jgi:putative FmdB family regulatory protein
MPIYEYNCDHCSYKFDKLVTSASARVTCPLCQGKVKKLMSTFSVGGSQPAVGGMPDGSQPAVGGMPDIAGPKMCTNCGPSPEGYDRN